MSLIYLKSDNFQFYRYIATNSKSVKNAVDIYLVLAKISKKFNVSRQAMWRLECYNKSRTNLTEKLIKNPQKEVMEMEPSFL